MPAVEAVDSLVVAAVARLEREMLHHAPAMASRAGSWMRQLSGTDRPADYFIQPDRFPMLRLPWWLEESAKGEPDPAFQADLVYSTVNGYYFIRLVDRVMDEHRPEDRQLLPLLGFFHTEFHSPYQAYFAEAHPFWEAFRSTWFESGEAAMKDADLEAVDRGTFVEISARKVCAAKIPIAAVCYRHGLTMVMDDWFELCDLLGCFEQFMDDLFDWQRDLSSGNATFFLTEARRGRAPGESVAAWVFRGGFEWGMDRLLEWLAELKAVTATLRCPELEGHVRRRESLLLERRAQIRPAFESLGRFAEAFGGS